MDNKRSNVHINVTLKRVRATIIAEYKAISIPYSECVCVCVALVIQHAMSMRRILLSSVPCLGLPYFYISSHKEQGFREKMNINYVFCVSLQ
jgi:hypothetical protein